MKRVRWRWPLGAMMAAVAGIAVVLAVGTRARPWGVIINGHAMTIWSDGSVTHGSVYPTEFKEFGPFLFVDWSDGLRSWYLKYTRGGR